jgi:hypothetical protein
MAASREELRDHLNAVIEAARELPQEDRVYLADTFLDELDRQYQLVPRSRGAQQVERRGDVPAYSGFGFAWLFVPFGLMFLLPVVVLTVVHVHAPVFLLAVVFLMVFRFFGLGVRRGPGLHGPRSGRPTRHYL